MPLQKQALNISFQNGLDTKTDDKQIAIGKFAAMSNSVFTKGKLLEKRNGYQRLANLPDSSSTYLTTFNGNLTAIGTNLEAYSSGSQTWVNRGSLQPAVVSTLPLIRNALNQTQADSVVAPNGLVCTAYSELNNSTATYKYAVADSTTGQNVILPTAILPSAGSVTGSPRTFLLGNYFIIVFTATITATAHLQYVAININTLVVSTASDLSTTYTPASTVAFDGYVANNNLYIAFNGSDGGGAIRVTYVDSTLTQHNTVVIASNSGTYFSVTADTSTSTPIIYVAWYNSSTPVGKVVAFTQTLLQISISTFTTNASVVNIASVANSGSVTIFEEISNNYSFVSTNPPETTSATNPTPDKTDFIQKVTVTQAGSVGSTTVVIRSLGLASKAFAINGTEYFLGVYVSVYQPTYFLVDQNGNIITRIAYENGSGYYLTGLPGITVNGAMAQIAYFFKDLIQSANKAQGVTSTGVYTQTGINLLTLTLGSSALSTAEIANNLNISGGFLWGYDGLQPVEQNFFVWPDHISAVASNTGGNMTTQQYYYQVTYEWADGQGNIFRSAPSIPVTASVTSGSVGSVVVKVPTLRLTYKVASPVKIVIYRWSAGQPNYFQTTSITAPVLNDTTIDSVSFTDINADTAIIGNSLIYTTGGVVEDTGTPPTSIMTLFKSRLVMVDAEDPNLLWYSKQVIEATPVEMSDLFTIYIAPTTSAQGATGPITALSVLDDKLIIFKKDAIYYITGTGPDNTGNNNDFSDPVFITSTVGCANQSSIVFMPQGLMFQSDKGIWLLGRDLSTNYIGDAVEAYNGYLVQSSVNIPATNQVRFTISNGVTLVYDYYYRQWNTFNGVPCISSTLYQGLHSFINSFGQVYQEKTGMYLDGSNPTLMSFTTGWINLAGLQGYQRAYFFTLLGTYFSPHKLVVQISYDYEPGISQQTIITPFNYNAPFGGDPVFGQSTPYGGTVSLEQYKIHLQRQTCQAFQITISEVFDSSYQTVAGAGLTLSGLDIVVGLKKQYRPIGQQRSVG